MSAFWLIFVSQSMFSMEMAIIVIWVPLFFLYKCFLDWQSFLKVVSHSTMPKVLLKPVFLCLESDDLGDTVYYYHIHSLLL